MYNWVLWFHIISLISWFSMLFYMPRLFVYHSENKEKKEFTDVIKVMEMKLYKIIGIPAMWATIISGSALAYMYPVNIFTTGGWFHAKLLFIGILIVFFHYIGKYLKELQEDRCEKSGKFFRMFNEIPTLIMFIIVALVVVKPF